MRFVRDFKTYWKERRTIEVDWQGAARVDAEYVPKYEELLKTKGKSSEEYQELAGEHIVFRSEYTDEIQEIESRRLLRKARKYMVDLSDLEGSEFDDTHWDHGHFGNRFLSYNSRNRLEKLVYKAKLEHDKHVREKWAFAFGITAGVVGLSLTAYQVIVLNQRLFDLSSRVSAIEKRLVSDTRTESSRDAGVDPE